MGLMPIDRGEMYFQQHRLDQLSEKQRLPLRRQMQMIFQNPYASLNPRMTIYQALFEPVAFHNPQLKTTEVDSKIESLLDAVGISAKWLDHYPHEFSGGQRQRISIARALSVDPSFIVADEPLAALDVSVQAQVLNLLMDLQQQRHLTYLFITHDLAVVEHFATRVAVMYLGRICELAPRDTLFSTPRHPYTQALLAAIPRLDSNHARPIRLIGEVPTIHQPPIGCVFQARCPLANQRCYQQSPNLITQTDGSQVACHAIEEGRTWK
jgi:peptide/nickel transport system ATP-binding protein